MTDPGKMEHWQELAYSASDGLKLSGRRYGWENRDTTPVVCLSGIPNSTFIVRHVWMAASL